MVVVGYGGGSDGGGGGDGVSVICEGGKKKKETIFSFRERDNHVNVLKNTNAIRSIKANEISVGWKNQKQKFKPLKEITQMTDG